MAAGTPDNDFHPSWDLSFTELVFSDFKKHRRGETDPSWFKIIPRLLTLTGMIATIIMRAQQCAFRAGHARTAWVLRTVGIILLGAEFVPELKVGSGFYLPHPVGVAIGAGMEVGDNVFIGGGVVRGLRGPDDLEVATICDDAKIYPHAVLVGGVRIGVGAEVAPNSVVLEDVPDYTIVAGIPARKIADAKGAPSRAEVDGASVKPG